MEVKLRMKITNKIIAVLGVIVTILGITASVASGIGYSGSLIGLKKELIWKLLFSFFGI